MQQPALWPLLRQKVEDLLGDYVAHPAVRAGLESYLVPPALGNRAGVLGALALAAEAR